MNAPPPRPLAPWSWGDRLSVTAYGLLIVGGLGLAVAHAVEGDGARVVLSLAVAAVGGRGLFAMVRRRSPAARAVEERRRRDAASARADMTRDRITALAAERGLDPGTDRGRVALMKAVREEDPRLGLRDAKEVIDDLAV